MVLCLCLHSLSGATAPKICACALKPTLLINFASKDTCMIWPGACLEVSHLNSPSWVHVVRNGKIMQGWRKSFQIKLCQHQQSCPKIITRKEWGALKPKARTPLSTPVKYAVIHHSDTPKCHSKMKCIERVRSIQEYHMHHNHWSDIGYNFLIGSDGNVYEGRGSDTVGAHTKFYNSQSIGICVIGNYSSSRPNWPSLIALKRLLSCLKNNKKLKNDYSLKGHRDLSPTKCPGKYLYNNITHWPHYKY